MKLSIIAVLIMGLVLTMTVAGTAAIIPTPRDASLYFTLNADSGPEGPVGTYNDLESNWYQHPQSNTNTGFFQINDGGTVASVTGGWTGSSFSITVAGTNANYANSYARLWEPDMGNDAWGGTFTTYTYTLMATGMPTTVSESGWTYNTADPTGITGSFDGTFVADDNGKTYAVHLDFNKNLWDGTGWSDTYTDETGTYTFGNYSTFATNGLGGFIADSNQFGYGGTVGNIPEPITLIIWTLLGGLGIVFARLRGGRKGA